MSESKLLAAQEIFAEFKAQPPLMRSQAMEKYLGAEVDWPATLADAREQKPGQVHVVCWPEPDGQGLIVGDVSLSNYPHLRQLRVDDPVRMRGRIRKIDTITIELEIQDLVFAQVAEAAHCPPRL